MIDSFITQLRARTQAHSDRIEAVLKFLYMPYKWLAFIPLMAIGTCVTISLFALCNLVRPGSGEFLARIWSWYHALITPMWVSVKGRENITPGQSYVIVANHVSQYDIFVVYGWIGTPFKWVMKQELRKVPIIGYFCRKMDHIFIDRSNPAKAVASINAAKHQITGGTSIFFFPEGTRSKTGRMGRFKKGAFRMALDLNLPILPVTIKGTGNILPAKTLDLFPGKAKMIIHPPVSVEGYNEKSMDTLMDRIRSIIESAT